jgi:hypothetical protein
VHWIGIGQLNNMLRDAGFTNTYYGNVPSGVSVLYAGNRTSTNDITWMMQRLANRSILTKPYADRIINLMRTQIWRSRIASGIPPGIGQASKPGALWLTSGLLQADTAIVNGPRYNYIISIIGDNGPPQEALRAVSRTVYTHFNCSGDVSGPADGHSDAVAVAHLARRVDRDDDSRRGAHPGARRPAAVVPDPMGSTEAVGVVHGSAQPLTASVA